VYPKYQILALFALDGALFLGNDVRRTMMRVDDGFSDFVGHLD
jgi:hypothetical protein